MRINKQNYPIDIVVPWVDGSDPNWNRERKRWNAINENKGDNREIRFRDFDLMRYWFRGVDKFLPWIHRVYFVTWGHRPDWLNNNCRKLRIIKHEDYIPEEYLPTFSSHTIELNLHRIHGLSEHFIYSNDDTFVLRPMSSKKFFDKGLPKLCGAQTLLQFKKGGIDHMIANDLEIVNAHFDKKRVVKAKPWKWFWPSYGKYNLYNLYLYPFDLFTGFRIMHTMNPFLKSIYSEVWKEEADVLRETCSNKFRTVNDVNQWLILYWHMAKNKFLPKGYKSSYFLTIGRDDETIKTLITKQSCDMICLNDDLEKVDFIREKQYLKSCFEKILPEKSCFEI